MTKDDSLQKLQEENDRLKNEIIHLKNSEERYKRLFDASPDIIIEVKKDFSVVICHVPGIPKDRLDKLAGSNIFDITPQKFHTAMNTAIETVIRTGEKVDYQTDGDTLGKYRYYDNHLSPIYNEKGEICSIYFISREITEQKEGEKTIIESEKKLKALFDSSQHLHILLGTDARCLWYNRKASTATRVLFGKDLMVGGYDHEYIPNTFLPSFREYFQKCLTGQTMIYDREYTTVAGEINHLELTLQPVFSMEDEIIGVSMIGIDITERRSYEDKLEKINKELVQQNMQLNQYSYIISHNLRGPIVTLLGLTDLFEQFSTDTTLQAEVIGHIKKSTVHLDNIIKDLNLILSNAEESELQKTVVNLEEEISVVKDLLKGQIEHASASIHIDFSEINTFTSVKSYVQSILLNLMSNSLKYKNKDLPAIIKVKSKKIDEKTICISFCDNGLGFDLEKNKDKIFGFYKRFHTHVEGKGLGLYLLKNQVEIMGGKVEVESEINKGTTFRIYLNL